LTSDEIVAIGRELGTSRIMVSDRRLTGSEDEDPAKYRLPIKGAIRKQSTKIYDIGRREGIKFSQIPEILNENWRELKFNSKIDDSNLFYQSAPGWNGLLAKYQHLKHSKTLGTYITMNGSQIFFERIYETLSNTPGMTFDEWKPGWFYVKNIEKRAGLKSLSLEKKILYIDKLFGFFSGIDEKMLEAHYKDDKIVKNLLHEKDIKVASLLSEISSSLRFTGEDVIYNIPELLVDEKENLLPIIEAKSLEELPENYDAILNQEYFEIENTMQIVLYVKAILNLIELKKVKLIELSGLGKSYRELEEEIEALNREIKDLTDPVFATLIRNRTIPELFHGKFLNTYTYTRNDHAWTINGLMEILDIIVERKITTISKESQKTSINAIRDMLSAA
ncbi:hypothetical protein ACFL58_00440, partial [Elusimicrobiota bacterium]